MSCPEQSVAQSTSFLWKERASFISHVSGWHFGFQDSLAIYPNKSIPDDWTHYRQKWKEAAEDEMVG